VFGRYPHPDSLNRRKLPIYVFDTCENYALYGRTSCNETRGVAWIWFFGDGQTQCEGLYLAPTIYDRGDTSEIRQVVTHELTHFVYFSGLDFKGQKNIPTWFTEGIAEFASFGTDFLPLVEQAHD
ncbi:MAG: hypothetical protein CUN57_02965, partial [Phototrophicales bacterium]